MEALETVLQTLFIHNSVLNFYWVFSFAFGVRGDLSGFSVGLGAVDAGLGARKTTINTI